MSVQRHANIHGQVGNLRDPGAGATIKVVGSPAVIGLISLTSETRTLARPVKMGQRVILFMRTDGGDITLTVTGGYNEDGDTTFTFSDVGQFVEFVACYDGTDYFWRKVSDYGLGNIAPGDADVLDVFSGLTATVTELNNNCDASSRLVALAPTASSTTTLNPTDHGGKTIVITTSTISFNIALPAMTGSGDKYRIAMGASLSSATMTVTATGKHLFGSVLMGSDDTVGTTATFNGLVVTNSGGATNITLNGTTLGGRKGDWIEIEDGAASVGLVQGCLNASGTEATPFS